MNLVSNSLIRDALGFEDMADINTAISSVLPAVTASLEVALDTRFALSTAEDVFYVPPHKAPDQGHVETKLRLRNGFIIPNTLLVTSADTPQALNEDPMIITTMGVRSYDDTLKGILLDYQTAYVGAHRSIHQIEFIGGRYIRVAYTYGFDLDASDSKLFDQSTVPEWLKQAALLKAQISLAGHPILKNSEAQPDVRVATDSLKSLLTSHLRFAPGSLVPM